MAIPISALQRNAAAVVRKVNASGQAESITDRGKVVAVISPASKLTGMDRLIAEGHVHLATGDLEEADRIFKEFLKHPFRGDPQAALQEQREDRF
jgi:antitoxin (DNA-binding transcriptional repressor) of toxin-antitoxin stability system